MNKYLLFSMPIPEVVEKLKKSWFTKENRGETVLYISSIGSYDKNPVYEAFWSDVLRENDMKLISVNNTVIDGTPDARVEQDKINNSGASTIIFTGGPTYSFLDYLRKSGLFNCVQNFINKGNKTVIGFSAGAIILSKTIDLAASPMFSTNEKGEVILEADENLLGIQDLSSLNAIPFDIYPHYDSEHCKKYLKEFETKLGRKVYPITNTQLLVYDGKEPVIR